MNTVSSQSSLHDDRAVTGTNRTALQVVLAACVATFVTTPVLPDDAAVAVGLLVLPIFGIGYLLGRGMPDGGSTGRRVMYVGVAATVLVLLSVSFGLVSLDLSYGVLVTAAVAFVLTLVVVRAGDRLRR